MKSKMAAAMAAPQAVDPVDPARNLVELIKQLIKEEQYEGVALLFTSESESVRNLNCLPEVSVELLHDVCLQHLNDGNHKDNPQLYGCAEELLRVIAAHAPAEELLLELLELIEDQKSEYVFTSALRALQVVLLRQGEHRARALEWSLNSIKTHLEELPLPEFLREGYDHKQQRLLEQNEQIQTLLMHYITVGLFYDPLVQDICAKRRPSTEIFRPCGLTRRNVLCCFLVGLLGKPLSLLDLSGDGSRKSNTYTLQCATSLTQSVTKCIVDPLYFLSLVEQRVRWKRRLNETKGVHEMSSANIFLVEEKLPLDALAIYYYMLLVEGVDSMEVPKVYSPLFIFEKGLYLANDLLHREEPALQERALLMMKQLLAQLGRTEIPAVSLELDLHKSFCHGLCNIVGYSSQTHLRQMGVRLLRQYILQFDDEGKYLVLKNLLHSIGHNGIGGYLATLYKDLVASALASSPTTMPSTLSGQDFRKIFLQDICRLPQGAETDLIDNSDKVISSLNAVRFFAIKDCDNRTGFWDFINDIEQQFLNPLRKGLDMSIAHYRAELQRVEKGLDMADEDAKRAQLELLDISIANSSSDKSKVDMQLDRQQKIDVLNQSLCTFDLMRSLLAHATECLERSPIYSRRKRAAGENIEICK